MAPPRNLPGRRGQGRGGEVDMVGDHVQQALRRALVGDHVELELGRELERLRHHLTDARQPGRAVAQRLGTGARLGDELLERAHAALRADDQHDRRAGQIGDRREVLDRIVAGLGIGHRNDDGERQRIDAEGVAVGLGGGDRLHADDAGGAGAVLDEELLLERGREMIGGDARELIGGAAGRERVDDADRTRRPVLCRCGGRKHGQHHKRRCETFHADPPIRFVVVVLGSFDARTAMIAPIVPHRPLPRLRGRVREGASKGIRASSPPPHPSPVSGGGSDRACRCTEATAPNATKSGTRCGSGLPRR